MFNKIILLLICCLVFISNPLASQSVAEKNNYNLIKKYSDLNNYGRLIKSSKIFFKKFPKSKYIPYIRLILAENESDPFYAKKKYNILLNKYRFFMKNDYVLYKICEILMLESNWNELRIYSSKGLGKYSKSKLTSEFKYFHILSLIKLNRFNKAEEECLDFINQERNYNELSRALALLSYINKAKTGYSREYIKRLKDLLLGFKDSNHYPAAIYSIGKFHSKRKEYDKSYSAFTDLRKKFPRSPESVFALKNINNLKKFNPQIVEYIPDDNSIKNNEKIFIRPNINLNENEKNKTYYSISIGPFSSLKRLKNLTKTTKLYGKTVIIGLRNGYYIHIGKHKNSRKALQMKIRLAEECGINGRIIRITENNNKKYIYGE